jgi:hypothetical protein
MIRRAFAVAKEKECSGGRAALSVWTSVWTEAMFLDGLARDAIEKNGRGEWI